MPQESYIYDESYFHQNHEKGVWEDAVCLYEEEYDYMKVLSASVPVPQPVVGLGISISEGDSENLDMELLGTACMNQGYTVSSTFITSASNKSSHIFDIKEEAYNEWQEKVVKHWSREDIMSWMVSVVSEHGIRCEDVKLSEFREVSNGLMLCSMSKDDFLRLEPNHGGLLHDALQKLLTPRPWHSDHNPYRGHGLDCALPGFNTSFRADLDNRCPDPMETWQVPQLNLSSEDLKCERTCSGVDSEGESTELKTKVKKKGVGRPPRDPKDPASRTRTRRKSGQKCGRLWEFIRDLLKNQKYCPGDICWVDHDQGMFRFVQSERVAKLWGEIKKNPKMNYEKLSRAMRYYYKSKVLLPVLGRRLVYRFGPNATNWRSNNPNFLCKMTPSNQ